MNNEKLIGYLEELNTPGEVEKLNSIYKTVSSFYFDKYDVNFKQFIKGDTSLKDFILFTRNIRLNDPDNTFSLADTLMGIRNRIPKELIDDVYFDLMLKIANIFPDNALCLFGFEGRLDGSKRTDFMICFKKHQQLPNNIFKTRITEKIPEIFLKNKK